MALTPGSEKPNVGAPDDYAADHPSDHPSDWGWHGEWGRWARISGWVVVVLLLLSTTATHYNGAGALALIELRPAWPSPCSGTSTAAAPPGGGKAN